MSLETQDGIVVWGTEPVTPKERRRRPTHAVRSDERGDGGRRGLVRAVCGVLVWRDQAVAKPTCADCQAALAQADLLEF